jgi:hypothetical protein
MHLLSVGSKYTVYDMAVFVSRQISFFHQATNRHHDISSSAEKSCAS